MTLGLSKDIGSIGFMTQNYRQQDIFSNIAKLKYWNEDLFIWNWQSLYRYSDRERERSFDIRFICCVNCLLNLMNFTSHVEQLTRIQSKCLHWCLLWWLCQNWTYSPFSILLTRMIKKEQWSWISQFSTVILM